MDINEAIFSRRSVREYTPEAVDDESVRRLIEAAEHAPNAVNRQPWTFTVIRNQGLLDKISGQAKALMLATVRGPDVEHFRDHLSVPHFQIFYHAPVLILISGVEQWPWIIED